MLETNFDEEGSYCLLLGVYEVNPSTVLSCFFEKNDALEALLSKTGVNVFALSCKGASCPYKERPLTGILCIQGPLDEVLKEVLRYVLAQLSHFSSEEVYVRPLLDLDLDISYESGAVQVVRTSREGLVAYFEEMKILLSGFQAPKIAHVSGLLPYWCADSVFLVAVSKDKSPINVSSSDMQEYIFEEVKVFIEELDEANAYAFSVFVYLPEGEKFKCLPWHPSVDVKDVFTDDVGIVDDVRIVVALDDVSKARVHKIGALCRRMESQLDDRLGKGFVSVRYSVDDPPRPSVFGHRYPSSSGLC